MLAVHEALGQGAIVGMLGDRVSENDRVVRCRFLGSDTAFPAGAMLLASLLDVPVVLAFGLYRGKNRYSVHFEPFAEHVATDRCSRNADIRRWTQRYVDCLEKYARRAPYNWFNFYDYWSEDTYASRR